MAVLMAVCILAGGCNKEKGSRDRTEASEMFSRICELTKEYTGRLEVAPDSADWATLCSEFEEKLDKISFSYPPDTDLLLTEGQNDTIHSLMQEYVRVRRERIDGLLHPVIENDSLAVSDSLDVVEAAEIPIGGSADASRSRGN